MKLIGVTGGVGSGKSEILRYMQANYKCRVLLADEAARALEAPGGAIYDRLIALLDQYPCPEPRSDADADTCPETRPDADADTCPETRPDADADTCPETRPDADADTCPEPRSGTRDLAAHAQMPGDGRADGRPGMAPSAVPITLPDGRINNPEMARRIFSQPALLQRVNALVHPAVKDYILAEYRGEQARGALDFFVVEAALLIECGYGADVDAMWYIYCDADERRRRLKASRGYSDEKIDDILASQLSEEEFRQNADVVIDNSGSLDRAMGEVDAALAAAGFLKAPSQA